MLSPAPEPMCGYAVHKMKCSDPVAFSCYVHGAPYMTQNGAYGDKKIHHGPNEVKLDDALAHVCDKQQLSGGALLGNASGTACRMSALAYSAGGSDQMRIDDDTETNPIKLSKKEAAQTRVAKRLETEGNVKVTITHGDFTNQWTRPEPCGNSAPRLHDRSPKAKLLTNEVCDVDGRLVKQRPPSIPHATWRILKLRERKWAVDVPSHAHKNRKMQK